MIWRRPQQSVSCALRHMLAAAAVFIMTACLGASAAWAVVLPEPIVNELDQRFDAFILANGFVQIDAASLIDEDWYTEARFPQMGSSVMRPDSMIDPVTRAILLFESQEAPLPHVRYRITYRLSVAAPDYPDVRHASIEVTRFNLGPLVRKEIVASYGSEHAAPAAVFGVGPHISWRFVTGSVMGMAANIVRASRKALTAPEARAAQCLGVPCLSREPIEGPPGEWQSVMPPDLEPVAYASINEGMPGPARIADYLFAYATRDGHEPAYDATADQPQITFVISINVVGQERTASGTTRQSGLLDDAISGIWTQRRQVGPDLVDWRRLVVHSPGRQ